MFSFKEKQEQSVQSTGQSTAFKNQNILDAEFNCYIKLTELKREIESKTEEWVNTACKKRSLYCAN